jgi:hypothetical protein
MQKYVVALEEAKEKHLTSTRQYGILTETRRPAWTNY